MQNLTEKFRQSFIVYCFRKNKFILSEKLNTLMSSKYHRVLIFLLKFLSCLDLELFAKIKKDLASTHSQKPGFLDFY